MLLGLARPDRLLEGCDKLSTKLSTMIAASQIDKHSVGLSLHITLHQISLIQYWTDTYTFLCTVLHHAAQTAYPTGPDITE